MKKGLFSGIGLTLLLAVLLCGCGDSSAATEAGKSLTKREWTGMLGDKFGYNAYESAQDFYSDVSQGDDCYDEIQACAEWGILPETGAFQPDNAATWRYAIETSVRAIGLDKLNSSDAGMEVTEDNLVEFFTSRIASVDDGSMESKLSGEDAALILNYAYDYAANLTLQERFEYTYNDGVKEASAEEVFLKGDGVTADVKSGASYNTGDVIYVAPTETTPAYAVRVTGVDGDQITYEEAGIEDIYQELQVTGTYEARVVSVEPAPGVNITVARSGYGPEVSHALCSVESPVQAGYPENAVRQADSDVMRADMDLTMGGNSVTFEWTGDKGLSLNVEVSDITVTPDVDFGIFTGLNKADVTCSFHDEAVAKFEFDEHTSAQIPLGSVKMVLGTTPLTVEFSLVANVGVDGEVTLAYSSTVVANVNYQKGNGLVKSVSNNNAACDFHAEVTVTLEPGIKVAICCIGRELANVKVYSGVVAIATVDADLLGNEPFCIDIYLYVPLRWAVNEDGCVMTDISNGKLKASGTVWGSDNSPVTQRFHWEDGVLVEACTRGQKVETPPVDEEGVPYDEYNIFEFEEIAFGFIRVSSQTIYLSKGESMAIGIVSLPDGYSKTDLIYQAEDPSVCSAGGGTVTAVGSGSTVLEISTSDGKYSIYLTVTVEAEYNDTSRFQPL